MANWVINLLIIGGYFIILTAIGIVSARKSKPNLKDFAIAGGLIGPFVLILTMSATIQSAFAYMGFAGWLYKDGIGAMLDTSGILVMAVAAWYIGRRLWILSRRYEYLTLAQLNSNFYQSKGTGLIVSIISVLFTLPFVGLQMAGGGYLFSVLSGGKVPFLLGALIVLVVTCAYTYIGGMRAVAWTDTFQGILMLLLFWLGGLWILKVGFGGIAGAFQAAYKADPSLLTLPGPRGGLTGKGYLSFWLIFVPGALFLPHYVIRVFAAKSLNVLKWAFVGTAIYLVYMVILTPAYALGAHAIYTELEQPDRLFPLLLLKYVPYWLAAFSMTGALAALMSTLDSQVHAVSILVSRDLYTGFVKKDTTEKAEFVVGRWAVVIAGILAFLILLYQPPFLVKLMFLSFGGIALLAPVTLGALFWRRSTKFGALASLIIGFAVNVLFEFIVSAPFDLGSGLWGLISATVVFIVVSLFTEQGDTQVKTHQIEVSGILGSKF